MRAKYGNIANKLSEVGSNDTFYHATVFVALMKV